MSATKIPATSTVQEHRVKLGTVSLSVANVVGCTIVSWRQLILGEDVTDHCHEVERARVGLKSSCGSVSGFDPSELSFQPVRTVRHIRSSLVKRQLSPLDQKMSNHPA